MSAVTAGVAALLGGGGSASGGSLSSSRSSGSSSAGRCKALIACAVRCHRPPLHHRRERGEYFLAPLAAELHRRALSRKRIRHQSFAVVGLVPGRRGTGAVRDTVRLAPRPPRFAV